MWQGPKGPFKELIKQAATALCHFYVRLLVFRYREKNEDEGCFATTSRGATIAFTFTVVVLFYCFLVPWTDYGPFSSAFALLPCVDVKTVTDQLMWFTKEDWKITWNQPRRRQFHELKETQKHYG